jgi:hypothetical protein
MARGWSSRHAWLDSRRARNLRPRIAYQSGDAEKARSSAAPRGDHCAATGDAKLLVYGCYPKNSPNECPGGKKFGRTDKRGQHVAICCFNGATPARDANGLWVCK